MTYKPFSTGLPINVDTTIIAGPETLKEHRMFEGITFTPELPPTDQMFKNKTVIETLCLGHYIHVDSYGYIVWMNTGHSLHNISNANPFTNLQRAVLFIQAYHDWEKRHNDGDPETHEVFLEKHNIEVESDRMPPKQLKPNDNELYQFNEPHITGGTAVVTITRRQAIEWTKQAVRNIAKFEPRDISDETMLQSFITSNWAWKVGEEKVKVATTAA